MAQQRPAHTGGCTMALLFSHTLTPVQKQDAQHNLQVGHFLPLPGQLQRKWSQVPADIDLRTYARPFIDWLHAHTDANDLVLVQGEFGLTVALVTWCISHDRRAVYATTTRQAKEVAKGDTIEMTHVFTHAGFRSYTIFTRKD